MVRQINLTIGMRACSVSWLCLLRPSERFARLLQLLFYCMLQLLSSLPNPFFD